MTATVTRPAGSEVIEEARETFRHARATSSQWPAVSWDANVAALRALGVALKRWDDLRCGIIPPWLTGFEPGAEGLGKALRQAADYAWDAAEDVCELIGENEMAAAAAGDGGTA
jgi:hypothetical protein